MQIAVRVSPHEKEFIEKMAKYLHKTGRIKEETVSDVIRYAVFDILGPLVLKEIEEKRYGGGQNE